MTKRTPSAPALTFHKTTFHPITRDGHPWLTASEIAAALGYSSDDAISRIYRRRAGEFTAAMSETVKLTASGNLQKEVRIFSLRGAHLLGMFARTERAAEFRRWVLDILERETAAPKLPAPPAIDLRAMIAEYGSSPTVTLPPAVKSALNRKAWALAHDAFELCQEYLERRVAYHSEVGWPRRLAEKRALEIVDETTLDMALAPRHYDRLSGILVTVDLMADSVKQFRAELDREISKLREKGVIR